MKTLFVLIIFCATLLTSCSTQSGMVQPISGSERVLVQKQRPGNDYFSLGLIEVAHGNDCGGFGSVGNYNGAYAMLKNKGVEMGATYIWIWESRGPTEFNSCSDNRYVIRGYAYKQIAGNQ